MLWRLKCDSGYVCELGEDTKCEIDLPSSCHVRILHGGWSHTVELAKVQKCQNWGVHNFIVKFYFMLCTQVLSSSHRQNYI